MIEATVTTDSREELARLFDLAETDVPSRFVPIAVRMANIAEALRENGELSRRGLEQELDVPPDYISACLKVMQQDGIVDNDGNMWRLT